MRHSNRTETRQALSRFSRRDISRSNSARLGRRLGCEALEERILLSVTADEQEFVYFLNYARHDPAAYEIEQGLSVDLSGVEALPPLAVNDNLMASAQFHADELAEYDKDGSYFSHQSKVTGDWPNKMVRDHGYQLPDSWTDDANYVESLAAGTWYDSAQLVLNELIEDIGIDPPGHRIHLLGTSQFHSGNREIGVGYSYDAGSYYDYYWGIHATRTDPDDTFLTGVVFDDRNGNRMYDGGEGLAGVTVTAGTETATTNAAGGWSIEVSSDVFTVTASGGAFEGTSMAIVPVGSDSVEIDFVSGEDWAIVNFEDNAAPTATEDFYLAAGFLAVPEDDGVLANDGDPDDDRIAAWRITPPQHGLLDLRPDGSFEYTPGPSFTRTDTFTYRALDGAAGSPETLVTIAAVDDLGVTDFWQADGLDLAAGDLWYRLETAHQGYLTFEVTGGDAELALYDDPDGNPLATTEPQNGVERIDYAVGAANQAYYARLSGTGSDVALRITNLVHHAGTTVTVHGTEGGDDFAYSPTGSHQITINGTAYHFEDAQVAAVEFDGGAGEDRARLEGSSEVETFTAYPNSATFVRSGLQVNVDQVEEINAIGSSGDVADLFGTAGAQTYVGRETNGLLIGQNNSFRNKAVRFGRVNFHADVEDLAKLYDSAGAPNVLTANSTDVTLSGGEITHSVISAGEVRAFASGDPGDEADLYDAAGVADRFTSRMRNNPAANTLASATMQGAGYKNYAEGFTTLRAHSSGDADEPTGEAEKAVLYGIPKSEGDDAYTGQADQGTLESGGFTHIVIGFPEIHVMAKSGAADVANLYGGSSANKDRFRGTQVYGRLTGKRDDGTTFFHRAIRFDQVNAFSGGGPDVADFYDSPYNDTFDGTPTQSRHYNQKVDLTVHNFPAVRGHSTLGGTDKAYLSGYDPQKAILTIIPRVETLLFGQGYSIRLQTYEEVYADPQGDYGKGSAPAYSALLAAAAACVHEGVSEFCERVQEGTLVSEHPGVTGRFIDGVLALGERVSRRHDAASEQDDRHHAVDLLLERGV
jgi:hypothetical protein